MSRPTSMIYNKEYIHQATQTSFAESSKALCVGVVVGVVVVPVAAVAAAAAAAADDDDDDDDDGDDDGDDVEITRKFLPQPRLEVTFHH